MINFSNTSATQILNELETLLTKNFNQAHSATVAVAADPAHALDLLAAGRPGATLIVLFYIDDAPAGEEDLEGDTLVEGSLRVAVVQHPGMAVKPAHRAPAVLATTEALRSFITRQTIDGVLGGMSYAGMQHLANYAGEILHGYTLTFKVCYAFELD